VQGAGTFVFSASSPGLDRPEHPLSFAPQPRSNSFCAVSSAAAGSFAGSVQKAILTRNAICGVTLFLFIGALWPLAVFPDLQLQDYPNHLARAFVLLHHDDPLLSAHYRVEWLPIPDLGWDLWAIAVGRYLPLEWAAKSMLIVSCMLTITGCFAINRILAGKWTPLPLLAFPFLFNAGYVKGFLSFDLGVGLSLWAMAWWLWVPNRRWAVRLAVATGFSTLLYIVHFYAWAVYGVFVLGIELGEIVLRSDRHRHWSRWLSTMLRDGTQALPALAMLWWSSRMALPPTDPTKAALGLFDWPWDRIGDAAQLIDGGTVAGVVLLCVVGAAFLIPFAMHWARLQPRAAVAIALYILLFFLLPNRIFDTSSVAWRALIPALLIAIASTLPLGRWRQRVLFTQLVVAALVTIAIPLLQIPSWRQSEKEKIDFLAAIDPLPEGSRLFWAHTGILRTDVMANEVGAYHVGAYAVVAKRALVQSMFVYSGQQPLRFRDPAFQSAPKNTAVFLPDIVKVFAVAGLSLKTHILRFDYVLMHGPDDRAERAVLPVDRLRLLNQVGDYRLYAVLGDPQSRQ
jgi:hypothetical protein